MIFLLTLYAASCAAFANFFIRKNSRQSESPYNFLLIYYLIALLCTSFMSENLTLETLSFSIVIAGSIAGLLNALQMWLVSEALKRGPTSPTLAFLNASSLFPILLLSLFFGEEYGFEITQSQLLGMGFVIIGLSFGATIKGAAPKWLLLVLLSFSAHLMILTLMHYRCLFFHEALPPHPLLPDTLPETADVWFMPSFFGAAFLLQCLFFLKEQKRIQPSEIVNASFGGLANMGSTALLLLATKWATPIEKGLIFPAFAVLVITLSSIWERLIYKVPFQIGMIVFCSIGILIAAFL